MQKEIHAQGTIEYLVLIGIIIVIGLFVVFLSTNFLDSGNQINNTTGNIKSTIGQGGISITEAVTNSDGNSLLTLKNNTSEKMILTSITPLDASGNAGTKENYNTTIHYGETITFSYPTNTNCTCGENETTKTCNYEIEITSAQGLTKKETIQININCVNDSSSTESDSIVEPLDTIAPTIELSSPTNNTESTSKEIEFIFTATDNKLISSCTLNFGNDSNIYTNISNGSATTINYTTTNDILVDWNITCTDGTNTTTSNTRKIDIDTNSQQITTCLELQEMNLDLSGNYELMNNIDCSETSNWGTWTDGCAQGEHFQPIGSFYMDTFGWLSVCTEISFTGNFNGNNFEITDINIGLSGETPSGGLFLSIGDHETTSTVENIIFKRANVYSYDSSMSKNVGILGGWSISGNIQNITVRDSTIDGSNDMGSGGFIIGSNSGIINNASVYDSNLFNKYDIGSIVGFNAWYGSITNCYAENIRLIGGDWAGEIYGQNEGTVTNCNTTNITIE